MDLRGPHCASLRLILLCVFLFAPAHPRNIHLSRLRKTIRSWVPSYKRNWQKPWKHCGPTNLPTRAIISIRSFSLAPRLGMQTPFLFKSQTKP